MTFLKRLKRRLSENYRREIVVPRKDLEELIHHFERIDEELRTKPKEKKEMTFEEYQQTEEYIKGEYP